MITLHYVRAQQIAFPYGEKNVAGPFETGQEAWDALKRLEPLWPEARLRKHTLQVSNAKGPAILGGPKITERTNA